MVDPITAMAAVSSAVNMIKKMSSTVDDVASLGPLVGKYFDAKQQAVKAVREAKKTGSNMGKAVELELALKSQRDFEEQLKGMFFPNNMDVWNNIQLRVVQMDKEDKEEAERERVRSKNAKRRKAELTELFIGIGLIIVIVIIALWAVVEFIQYCKYARCGR